MKYLNAIVSTLVLLVSVYLLWMKYGFSGIGSVTYLLLAWMYIFSLIVYRNVYRTADKSTEKYVTWKNMLPERTQIRKRLWMTVMFSVLSIAAVCALRFSEAMGYFVKGLLDLDFLPFMFSVVALGIVVVPLLLINMLWAKYYTLKDSKEIFKDIVQMLHDPNSSSYSQYFLKNTPDITPDTVLAGSFCQTDRDYFNMALFVNDLGSKYNLKFRKYPSPASTDEEKKHCDFMSKAQHYLKTKTVEDGDNMIRAGMAFGREFCRNCKTVGGIAEWVHEKKSERNLGEAQNMVND